MALRDFFIYNEKKEADFALCGTNYVRDKISQNLGGKLKTDILLIREYMNFELNRDMRVREFSIRTARFGKRCALFFIEGLVSGKDMNRFVLSPLMNGCEKLSVDEVIRDKLPDGDIKRSGDLKKLSEALNFGSCVLVIDGEKEAVIIDVKGWQHRGISEAKNEIALRGPADSFNEMLTENCALVRRLVKDSDLIIEERTVGRISATKCALIYLKNIAATTLVDEARKRLGAIETDFVFSSAEVEQFIEDKTFVSLPQFLSTERPDRVARAALEGRVAILVDGSPFAIIAPVTLFELNESPEDNYLRFPYANMIRLIRQIAYVFSLLLPGLYIAIMDFHQEILPTDLLMSIVEAREKVPFPTLLELLLMEISLEIVREAGNRVPGTISSPLSIVGALILGQAAVEAKIVSPIMIIVVASSAIGSLATPNYYLALSARVLRFGYIFAGAAGGFLGVTTAAVIHLCVWTGVNSLGVPMLSPVSPRTKNALFHSGYKFPVWKRELRPDYLNTQFEREQPDISRRWRRK